MVVPPVLADVLVRRLPFESYVMVSTSPFGYVILTKFLSLSLSNRVVRPSGSILSLI